jgi:Tfp pilus assembly protein PilF
MAKGDYERAAAEYRKALTLPGTQTDATPEILGMELAEAIIQGGHPKEAMKELDALLAKPNMAQNPSAIALQGMAALRSGDRAGGNRLLTQAASLDAQLAKRWYESVPGMIATGQYERSLLYYDAVDVMQPGFAGIHFGRGQIYALMGWKAEAIAAYTLYLQSDTTSAWAEQARREISNLQR